MPPADPDSPAIAEDAFGAHLARTQAALPPAARRVARFITENRALTLASSAADLASRIGTSDATVVRAVQAMGFGGLPELKRMLAATLAANPATPAEAMRRSLAEAGEEAGRAIAIAIEAQREAIEAIAAPEAQASLRAAALALHPARRILVFGIGPSAALARYVTTLLGRAGRATRTLNASGIALADQLLDLGAGDALLVLAYGRAYREVATVFGEARRLALPLVLVTDSLDRALARHADVVIPARRGRARRVALHGATLAALEALVMGLAALDGERALASLDHLNDLRAAIAGGRQDIG
ncbi:MurR/RpiR family transcriptional regulator [Roseomonas hellenica]|uniref:MurR/RpiR family transcriptional regulator n=1 Tax=Plastoroseomonas hellenica TaxID=2687306 RepID=A0ABS5ESE5_9PROT|nr:MurR/RpiR family transcriptional regulator [Plastoroseomonas hellenica]MBR0663220.1 MurR/RpiR family transcriptional regulator [Plastoroseomonas hellenica]